MKPYLVITPALIPTMRMLYGDTVDLFVTEAIPILKAAQTAKKARRTEKRMKKKSRRKKLKDWEDARRWSS